MRHHNSAFDDLSKRVPWAVFDRLTAEHMTDRRVRRLTAKNQLVALLYGQLSGAASLRELVGADPAPSNRAPLPRARPTQDV